MLKMEVWQYAKMREGSTLYDVLVLFIIHYSFFIIHFAGDFFPKRMVVYGTKQTSIIPAARETANELYGQMTV